MPKLNVFPSILPFCNEIRYLSSAPSQPTLNLQENMNG